MTKRERARYVAELAALTTAVVLAGGATVGVLVTRAVEVNAALTDDVIASLYVLCLLALSQLVPWLTPRRARLPRSRRDAPT